MNYTEEEMIERARIWADVIYRHTRENEPSDFDKFILQLLYEYLHLKEKK